MKKQFFFLVMFFFTLFAKANESGSCGEKVTYTYIEESHTLTISGEGNMVNYAWNNQAPWYNYKDKIEKVIINEGVCSIGDLAFDQCEQMNSISIPNSVTSIGQGAFRICSSLKEVTIPQKVTKIGSSAFYACDGLTSVYISDIESWCKVDFGDAGSNPCSYAHLLYLNGELLKQLVIPENITTINDYVFYGCTTITSVTMNNSVTTIGEESFAYCSALTTISISDNVTSIGKIAFLGCENLVSITIPDGVTCINDATFELCRSLTSITLPNSVVSIGDVAFARCESLSFVKFSDSLYSIGKSAFYGCNNLTSLKLPDDIEVISENAFAECSNIKEVEIGTKTNTIGYRAFYNCVNLRELKIGNNVENIEISAFMNCYSLQSLVLPNNVKEIGMQAFCYCQNLKSVTIGLGLKTVSSHAFSGSNRIEEVHIQSLESFCNINFENESSNPLLYAQQLFCQGFEIKDLTIPEGVTSIGNYAFVGFSGLTSVLFPSDITTIGESAFKDCSSITSIILPEKLQFIKGNAFSGCYSLKKLVIPSSVEFIYQESFAYCSALESIDVQATTPPFLYENSFSDYSVPVKVPKGCKEAYQLAQGWKNFTNINDVDKYKLIYMVDGEDYKSYEIEEGTSISPEPAPTKEGYTFSGWGEVPKTMPAHDVTVTGTFTVNKYKLTYSVDGEEYKSYDIEYGSAITSETEPTKEGYTFSGWSEIPETMPANDVTVTGTFTINKYKITYIIDGEVYLTEEVEYGSMITPLNPSDHEGYDFAWDEYPDTMPAHDITINGTYTSTGIDAILVSESDVKIFTVNGKLLNKLQKGMNILRYKDGRTRKIVVK